MINVVLQKRRLLLQTQRIQRPLEDLLPHTVVGNDIEQPHTFGCRILDVPHIDVDTAGIEQKSAIPRGLIPASIMDIHNPDSLGVEDMILNLDGNGIRADKPLVLGCHTPILGLKSKNAIYQESFRKKPDPRESGVWGIS